MAYSRWQYPFDQYDKAVAALKREMDRNATSAYPMTACVTDSKGQVLSEATYKNVWDRKPKYVSLVTEDWEAPVTVAFLKNDEPLRSVVLEKVTVRPQEVQLEFGDIIAPD